MLEDLGSLTATSECIFSWKRFVKKITLSSKDASRIENDFSISVAFLQNSGKHEGRFFVVAEDLVSDWSRRCCWGRRCRSFCPARLVPRGGGRIEGVICSTTASSYDPWWCSCQRSFRGPSRPSVPPVFGESATLVEAGPISPPAGALERPMPPPRDSPRRLPRKTDIHVPRTTVDLRPRTLLCNRNVHRSLFNILFDK